MQSALGRFVSTYGWRAYAIPVLVILTIVLLVFTIGDSGSSGPSANGARTPDTSRNTDVNSETKPIGAPTGRIDTAALAAGALPDGGPFTLTGRKTFHVVPGTGKRVGGGQEYTYTVEVEDGLRGTDFGGDQAFAKMVDATLSNPRSWTGDGKVAFRRVDSGDNPGLRISLSSTGTTKALCDYHINLEASCYFPPDHRVILNEARWVRGALAYQGDDLLYRQFLLNHDTGHGIGYAHDQPCETNGALAPVMMQQSFGVANKDIMVLDPDMRADTALVCTPNPWPFPDK